MSQVGLALLILVDLPSFHSGRGREEPDRLQTEHHELVWWREALPWWAGNRPLQGTNCVTLLPLLYLHFLCLTPLCSPMITPTFSYLPTYGRCMFKTPPPPPIFLQPPYLRIKDKCTVSTHVLLFLIFSSIWYLNLDHELSKTFSISAFKLSP